MTLPTQLRDKLRERLASLEHEQWMSWAGNVLETESVSPERRARWDDYFCEYSELAPEVKAHDRVWADKALLLIEKLLHDEDYIVVDCGLRGT